MDSTNSTTPFISIVVPVYNPGEHFLPCLESLVNQTLDSRHYEVLLVDDGSNDGSEAVCDEYALSQPNFRVFHQPNSGHASAPRNFGIEQARGTYLFFHDADDLLYPETCERLMGHALAWGSDVIGFPQCFYYPDKGTRSYAPPVCHRLQS